MDCWRRCHDSPVNVERPPSPKVQRLTACIRDDPARLGNDHCRGGVVPDLQGRVGRRGDNLNRLTGQTSEVHCAQRGFRTVRTHFLVVVRGREAQVDIRVPARQQRVLRLRPCSLRAVFSEPFIRQGLL